jgi:dihydroorotate dehydrogenase
VLYRLLRPLLFTLDPESAHHFAHAALGGFGRSLALATAFRRWVARPADQPVEVLGLRFPHPVGLAAGFDKDARAVLGWWALGFGFAELGTVTPRPQIGNPRPRMFRDQRRRALINRMGFNNAGAEEVARRLEALGRRGLRPPMPLGVSLGKNKETPLESAADDYRCAAELLAPLADYVAVNVSSPNTPGLRDLQAEAKIREVVCSVRGAMTAPKPLLVKVAPELGGDALRALVDVSLQAGAQGFIATNTLSTEGQQGLEAGGLSGRPLHAAAVERVHEVAAHAGRDAVVVGCGGIEDARTASDFFAAGAKLVQLYSAMVFEGPFVAARISRGLRARA